MGRECVLRTDRHVHAEPLERRWLLAIALGTEFKVNTFTSDAQSGAAIAADANGDFVVTWQSYYQDGSGQGIYAQRYNVNGVRQGAEFKINTSTLNNQQGPAIAMDADGDFVIAWSSYNGSQDGSSTGVYAQRYNAAGVAQGGEFLVNTFTTGTQSSPSVGMDSAGNIVIAWQSLGQDAGADGGIYARRYNSAGAAQGTEFLVNSFTTGAQLQPDIAMNDFGDFVVVWVSFGQDGDSFGIYGQEYHAGGSTFGGEFLVNQITTGSQATPKVAMDEQGDYLIAWSFDGADGSLGGIKARFFEANQAPGNEFRVNTFTTDQQVRPDVAAAGEGDFIVAWDSNGQDGSSTGVYAQRYKTSGPVQGGEFRVNTYTTFVQTAPVVAMDSEGDYVIAWTSFDQDGSDGGIFARQFTQPVLVDGTLIVHGTPGKDTITLTHSGSNVIVTLNGEASVWDDTDIVHISVNSGEGNDTVTIGSEVIGAYVLGGGGNDIMTGGTGHDTFAGASGKDKLFGNGGNDVLRGGKHNDQASGGDGDDRMYGDESSDLLDGGGGKDREYGGGGDDTILGGNHNDTLYGEAGNDSLDGGAHNDRLFPGPGQDTAKGNKGDDGITDPDDNLIDLLDGGPGTDFADAGDEDILANLED
jgi:Ca2+-binding RTX toxin-like protein